MYRKYVILTLAFVFALGATGCTSSRTEGDDADVEASTDDGLEVADANENNSDLDVAASDKDVPAPTDDLAPAEQLPADPGQSAANSAPQVAPGDISETPPSDAPPAADLSADQPTPTDDASSSSMASATPTPDPVVPPTPEPSTDAAPPAPPVQASLQKIKDHPYRSGKTLVNAVYIARKGDNPEAISQKVFGTNSRVKELCRVNSSNCKRPTKVGDKFYYNSPQRPTDEESLKTFYEDAGVAPETYVAKSGDNIRKVGKQLLGDSRSWMELWATNSVESKGSLDEGTQLRYWTNAPAPTLAKADASPETAEMDPAAAPAGPDAAAPGDMADAGAPPPPPPPPSDLPPAPSADPNAQAANAPPPTGAAVPGAVEAQPPPPPPPPPPPAAPDVAKAGADQAVAATDGSDPNQTMALGVGAVLLLAAAALFISIRKKRQRRQVDYTATQTQIDG